MLVLVLVLVLVPVLVLVLVLVPVLVLVLVLSEVVFFCIFLSVALPSNLFSADVSLFRVFVYRISFCIGVWYVCVFSICPWASIVP